MNSTNPERAHVMIDLETLGTIPGSVILSIGAVRAYGAGTLPAADKFFCTIGLESSIWAGLMPSSTTVGWWKGQDTAALARLTREPHFPRLKDALENFTGWLSGSPGAWLWGDSAAFDLGLLAAAYRAVGLDVPWGYRQECDYRTLRQARPDIKKPYNALAHDSLADAETQLKHLFELLPAIGWQP